MPRRNNRSESYPKTRGGRGEGTWDRNAENDPDIITQLEDLANEKTSGETSSFSGIDLSDETLDSESPLPPVETDAKREVGGTVLAAASLDTDASRRVHDFFGVEDSEPETEPETEKTASESSKSFRIPHDTPETVVIQESDSTRPDRGRSAHPSAEEANANSHHDAVHETKPETPPRKGWSLKRMLGLEADEQADTEAETSEPSQEAAPAETIETPVVSDEPADEAVAEKETQDKPTEEAVSEKSEPEAAAAEATPAEAESPAPTQEAQPDDSRGAHHDAVHATPHAETEPAPVGTKPGEGRRPRPPRAAKKGAKQAAARSEAQEAPVEPTAQEEAPASAQATAESAESQAEMKDVREMSIEEIAKLLDRVMDRETQLLDYERQIIDHRVRLGDIRNKLVSELEDRQAYSEMHPAQAEDSEQEATPTTEANAPHEAQPVSDESAAETSPESESLSSAISNLTQEEFTASKPQNGPDLEKIYPEWLVPKQVEFTQEEYLAQTLEPGVYRLKTSDGRTIYMERGIGADGKPTNKFASEHDYNEFVAGRELEKGKPYDAEADIQAQDAYYDKKNGVALPEAARTRANVGPKMWAAYEDATEKQVPTGEVEGPDYEAMTYTELARELGKIMYSYKVDDKLVESLNKQQLSQLSANPADRKQYIDPTIAETEAKIRAVARAKYEAQAKIDAEKVGDPTILDSVDENMEHLESMADRYLRAKLDDEALKLDTSQEMAKPKRRWLNGLKRALGITKYAEEWDNPKRGSGKVLHKDINDKMKPEEKQRQKERNRYNTILGRSVIFAQSPKMEAQYGPDSQTWKVHEFELQRDYPEQFERKDGTLTLKEIPGPMTQEYEKRREEAKKRLERAERFKERG